MERLLELKVNVHIETNKNSYDEELEQGEDESLKEFIERVYETIKEMIKI